MLNNEKSDTKTTNIGVAQGSVLGPILFSLLINDLPMHIRGAATFLFADDSNFVVSGPPEIIGELLKRVERCMEDVLSWMEQNYLQLNIDKTKMVVIGKPNVIKSIGPVEFTVRGMKILSSETCESLGLIIDSQLNWTHHISRLSRNCNSVLWSLYPMQPLMSQVNRKLIVNSYVLSKIRYMSPIWGVCSASNLKKIEACIRNAGRFVLNLRKYDTVKYLISTDLSWLFPSYMHNFETLKLAFDINTASCPPYFYDYLNFNNSDSIRCTRNQSYLQTNSEIISKSFRNKAKQLWLNLPEDIVNVDSPNIFKSRLFKFYLDKQSNESMPIHDEDSCDFSCIEAAIMYAMSCDFI